MEKSTSIKEIASALTKFQAEVQPVKKDGVNPYFKSKYATLESTIETVREPLQKVGLSFSQFPSGDNELVTILMHSSGEFIQSAVKIAPKDNTPQGQGSAITYMRRYALSAILGIATEEDDDGNQASKPKDEKKEEVKKDAPKVNDKIKLKHLCKLLKIDLTDIKKAENEIKTLTGLEPNAENRTEIVSRLEVLVTKRANKK